MTEVMFIFGRKIMEDKYAQILDSTILNSTIIWNLLLESEDTGEILHNRKDIKSEDYLKKAGLQKLMRRFWRYIIFMRINI